MSKSVTSTAVKGGTIRRDAKTGRFVSVSTGKKVSATSHKSTRVLNDVVKRRTAALTRLANR